MAALTNAAAPYGDDARLSNPLSAAKFNAVRLTLGGGGSDTWDAGLANTDTTVVDYAMKYVSGSGHGEVVSYTQSTGLFGFSSATATVTLDLYFWTK